ncbi:hypothetical protein GOP47_0024360 [Adiantum capillus-veneris]|uniref:Uncharacterized protein n=1 Tax=Adiantum capillus-veneris TaxID=13818 RepID=A0A9D4U2V2_ADICA|nr:hypothetical protein GOP47_0024360 [Adiantum capillus-veneris]
MAPRKKAGTGCGFLRACLGMGGSLHLQRQLSSAGYGRLSSAVEEEAVFSGQALAAAPTLQLGSASRDEKAPVRQSIWRRRPGAAYNICGVQEIKEAWKQALQAAKKGAPHFNELLVGNKLLMQIAPAAFLSLSSSHPSSVLRPSAGLITRPSTVQRHSL